MTKPKKRIKARRLRKKGRSIKNIAKILQVSKSSVSLWCSDIELTEEQKRKLFEKAVKAGHKGRIIGARVNKKRRLRKIKKYNRESKLEIGSLLKRDLFILGVAIYWGEGSKTSRRFEVINSEPEIIKLMMSFITDILEIPNKDLRFRVQINMIHKPRIDKVINFWKSYLCLDDEQIGKPYYIKSKPQKVYENYDSYYGIARLRVVKSSELLYKTMGYINAIKSEVDTKEEFS